MAAQSQTQSSHYPTRRAGNPWLARITLIVSSILILSNLIAALLLAGYQIYYDGLIYPGVHVWGVDLSGMTPADAAAALNGQFTYPQMTTITFRDGDEVWPASAAELGIRFDVERTVQAAYEVGRHPKLFHAIGQQVQAWRQGIVVSPVLVYDQHSADLRLAQIAAQINRPVMDATLVISDTQAVTTTSQVGRTVDQQMTLSNLNLVITRMENVEVPVVVNETEPSVVDASDTAAVVNAMLASDYLIYAPDTETPQEWKAAREAIAAMLVIERAPNDNGEGEHYTVRLDEQQLISWLNSIAPELQRDPVNARFNFDEKTGTMTALTASVTGRSLNVPATIQLIQQMAPTADHRIPLVFDLVEPGASDTAAAEELGVKELIAFGQTAYYGSSEARKANIATAAAKFNGVMIAPGELFSFNRYLGSVSAETGFSEGMIIYNGRTIKGVGGGVCQVSTTMFQAAFYAGFPIHDRTPHGYWVGYYDSGEGKGMDATVYEPIVDMTFTNDTPYWMLIETNVDLPNQTIRINLYSTKDGRTVVKDGPYTSNHVAHGPPLYEVNPNFTAGQVKQVDYAVDGFDTVVYRQVFRDGRLLFEDQFVSHYIPWQAIYQVAPGNVPPGAQTVNGN